jgi:hypothetical protein
MKYATNVRGLVLTTALAALVAATGCSRSEPLLPHDDPAAELDGGGFAGSGHANEPETTTTSTAGPDSVGRGPGTIGSGH